jgi:dTDP-4-amino-4,6-dideoxygalactose transaminase
MIKFLDLQKINAQHKAALIKKSAELIDSGWYIQGEMVKQFEQELAAYIGVKHAIGVANGLDALTLILKGYLSLGRLKPGDEVLVPANTYIASILAISENGLVPVLVEPDPKTFNISVETAKKCTSAKTKALLNVHLYGLVSWSEELDLFLKEHPLICVEDNAQAIGAKFNNRKTGSLGDAAGFSFYPGKNLGCLGDGGAVCTNDDELAGMVRIIGNYGSQKKYLNQVKGVNSRLDEIQAGFLSVKLPFLDAENELRRRIAREYIDHISNPLITLPEWREDSDEHVWHLFVVRTSKRDELQAFLLEQGIQTLIHYPIPPHKQEAYKEWNSLQLPVTEQIHESVLSLPISPVMDMDEVQQVIQAINQFTT